MAAQGVVAVVGARVLPGAWAHQVGEMVRFFAGRGWGVGSGGAQGADAYALHALLGGGRAACARSVVFLPGAGGGATGISVSGGGTGEPPRRASIGSRGGSADNGCSVNNR